MDVPPHLNSQLIRFKSSLNGLKSTCQNFLQNYDKLRENIRDNALEEASLDLAVAFTINSLFWIYLTCKGVDPKSHGIKDELNRIKTTMIRLKQIKEGPKAPKVDVPAARRFINHSLSDPKAADNQVREENGKDRKRKRNEEASVKEDDRRRKRL